MASPPVAEHPGPGVCRSKSIPDRCLLLSDSRIQDDYQDLIPIWDHVMLRIGRDPKSDLFIENDGDNLVSRDHCEVYVVVYDESTSHVYVRDRQSFNGTFVNNVRIGAGSGSSSGYLLENGDVIGIHPFWTLTLCDKRDAKSHPLTTIQEAECKFFQDKYLITKRCLGQGSEGVVYLATEAETKKQLVCKVVDLKKIKGRNSPEDLRRKLQEADVLRQLQHPNILPYVDAMVSPHSLFTFTELATGGDLWSYLYQHDSVGEFQSRVIIRQVVRALDYIHKKGVIHRDLKPENILLAYSPRINCHRVMLSDFGAYAVPRRSRLLTLAGTVNFQAPEIQSQSQPHTAAVDIWSLGVVVLTMLMHNTGVRLAGLDRLDQQQLGEFLEKDVFNVPGKFSSNCEQFVWQSLQVLPSDRISAAEAQCHDWLCTPEQHLEHFQELDRRSMGGWKAQSQLRPMPLELPDVLTEQHLSISETQQRQLLLSDHFIPAEERSQSQEGVPPGSEKPDCYMISEVFVHGAASSSLDSPSAGVTETRPIELPRHSPGHITGVRGASAAAQSYANRPRRPRVKIRDSAPLPLTGLNKHPNPGSKSAGDQRNQVLEELKRVKARVLPDVSPLSTKV